MWKKLSRLFGADDGKKVIILIACCEGAVLLIAALLGLWMFLSI